MATAPSKTPADRQQPVPPEEQFWQRYSPHHELPLSGASSFALHALVLGLFGLLTLSVFANWFKTDRSLPVEPVRLDIDSGGGGSPRGVGDGPGIGRGQEDVPDKRDTAQEGDPKAPDRPSLDKPTPTAPDKVAYDDSATRFIKERNSEAVKAFRSLDEATRRQLSDGLQPGKGRGGPGSGGGRGSGKGKGEGSGRGEGKATLNQREKRMLRWSMHFNTANGADYLRQLQDLGAILAIPIHEVPRPQYRIVRDLTPGRRAKLLREDISKIQRIFWIDDKPQSVLQVMAALGHPELRPSRFVAFMPQELEQKLYDMEKDYMVNRLGQPYDEERIFETHFRVVSEGGRYRPQIMDVRLKR
jgi:hypothetical protein